jgi:hypothetical protein
MAPVLAVVVFLVVVGHYMVLAGVAAPGANVDHHALFFHAISLRSLAAAPIIFAGLSFVQTGFSRAALLDRMKGAW